MDTLLVLCAACCLFLKKIIRRNSSSSKEGTMLLTILSWIFLINFFISAALAGAGQFQKLLITNLKQQEDSITVRNEVQVKVISIFNI